MTTGGRMLLVWIVTLVVLVGTAVAGGIAANSRPLIRLSPAPRTTIIPPVTTTPFGYVPESSWSGSDLNPTNGSFR